MFMCLLLSSTILSISRPHHIISYLFITEHSSQQREQHLVYTTAERIFDHDFWLKSKSVKKANKSFLFASKSTTAVNEKSKCCGLDVILDEFGDSPISINHLERGVF